MSKTTHQIINELTMYQCCAADRAIEYIAKEINGIQEIEGLYASIVYLTLRIETLKKFQSLLSLQQYTQQEIEDQLEKLNDECGCMTCNIPKFMTDTIPTSMTNLFY